MLTGLARQAVDELEAYIRASEVTTGRRDNRGLPKLLLMAAMRLASLAGSGDPLAALPPVVQAYGEAHPYRRSSLRKCASQARAVYQFGFDETLRAPAAGGDAPNQAYAELDRLIGPVRAETALRRRAAALQGSRGGRPPAVRGGRTEGGRGGRVVEARRAVEALISRALGGDANAISELADIRQLLR
jgi:hypothetical protein